MDNKNDVPKSSEPFLRVPVILAPVPGTTKKCFLPKETPQPFPKMSTIHMSPLKSGGGNTPSLYPQVRFKAPIKPLSIIRTTNQLKPGDDPPASNSNLKRIIVIKKNILLPQQNLIPSSSTLLPCGPLKVTQSQLSQQAVPDQVIIGPGGPGNLTTQPANERRLVRKFCLVSQQIATDVASPSEKVRQVIINKPKVVPDKFGPRRCPMPKILATNFNESLNREERHIMFPPRRSILTDAQTQTDPIEIPPLKSQVKLVTVVPKGKRTILETKQEVPEVPEKKKRRDSDDVLNPNSGILEALLEGKAPLPPKYTPSEKTLINTLSEDTLVKARRDYENCLFPDDFGNLPLHRAVISGDYYSIVRQSIVLKGCGHSIDKRNSRGLTPLHLALIQDCPKMGISKLVSLGADVFLRDNKENTVIHLAVLYSKMTSLEVLLPRAEKLLNQLNDDGLSALHLAAMNGKIDHVKLLVNTPTIDLNLQDARSGRTALFHALECNHLDLALLLVRHGSCKEIQNFAGQNITLLASENENLRSVVQEICLISKRRKKPKVTID